jgi:adenylate cyclase
MEAARSLNVRILPYLQKRPNIGSAQFASERGVGFLVLQTEHDRFRNRIVNPDVWGARALWLDLDRFGNPVGHSWHDDIYDPRGRPWFGVHDKIHPRETRWTEPYILHATGKLGMSAAAWWKRGESVWVVAVDVLLEDITRFTQNPALALTDNNLRGVFTADWRVVGLPGTHRFSSIPEQRAALLRPVSELGSPAIAASLQKVEPLELGRTKAVPFESNGMNWWAGVTRLPVPGTDGFLIVVAAPDNDLLLRVADSRTGLLLAAMAIVLTSFGISWWLARLFSRPLAVLREESQRLVELDFRDTGEPLTRIREIHELAETQRRSLRALESFSRYVPMGVVRELVRRGEVARIGGAAYDVTALFTDIAGFTRIAERLDSKALADHLAAYFEIMIHAIESRQGTVDKLIGDGIFAFWGAPTAVSAPERAALESVLAARKALQSSARMWGELGLPPLPTRFGLASGRVIVGNMGSPRRLAYTAIGDTVNLASRIESLNKQFGTEVLADTAVRDGAGGDFAWRRIDCVRIFGRSEPVVIHELLGTRGLVSSSALSNARAYEAAWDLYAGRAFADAANALGRLHMNGCRDMASATLLARCQALCKEPPPASWKPVSEMTTK